MHTERASDAAVSVRMARDPESLAPFGVSNQAAIDALNLMTPSLLMPETSTVQIAPYLVEGHPKIRWQGDSLTILSYRLRSQARWNTGEPVLATDIAFTYKMFYNPELPVEKEHLLLSFLKDVRLDPRDPRRFSFVCRGNSSDNALTVGDMAIVSEAGLDPSKELRKFSMEQLRNPSTAATLVMARIAARYQKLELNRHPENLPTCGPYRLTKWQSDSVLSFTRQETWWGEELPGVRFTANPKQINFLIISDETLAGRALRKGAVDVYPHMPVKLFNELRHTPSASSKLTFYLEPTYDVIYAGYNTGRPALADAATRQALAYLFDPSYINQLNESGDEWLTVGCISPADSEHYNDSLSLWPYSPSYAVRALRAAGWRLSNRKGGGWWRGGTMLKLDVPYRIGDTVHEQVAKQLATSAREIGIPVELYPIPAAELHTLLRKGKFDVFIQTLKGSPFGLNFKGVFSRAAIGSNNFTQFGTAESDQLLDELAAAEQPAERRRLVHRFQAMMRTQMPIVPLFVSMNRIASSRWLTDLHVNSLKPGFQVTASRWKPIKEE
jgi:peptide/nickel transport system substrate-binding protein